MNHIKVYKIERVALLILAAFSAISLAMIISSCSSSPVAVVSPQEYPVTGWDERYSKEIISKVTNNLLLQTQEVMGQFCKEWETLSIDQRKIFYSDLLFAIASPESNYDRAGMYLESTLGIDPLTKIPVISESLFQLSYQDRLGYPQCKFDEVKDRSLIQSDYENKPKKLSSWDSQYPNSKTIDNPIIQIDCAMSIIDKLLTNNDKEFANRLGAYWSTLRRKNADAYSQIWVSLRSRSSPCH